MMFETRNRDSVRIGVATLNELNRREVEVPDRGEGPEGYLMHCERCGQDVDVRYFGDTLYHTTLPDHGPLTGKPEFEFVPVEMAEQ